MNVNDLPKISVLCVIENEDNMLTPETLRGIEDQIYQTHQIVFVVNESCPCAINEINEFTSHADNRLKTVLITSKPSPKSVLYNKGAEICSGDMIAFLTNDASWHPTHLMNMAESSIKYPTASIYFDCYNVHEIGTDEIKTYKLPSDFTTIGAIDYFTLYNILGYHYPKLSFVACWKSTWKEIKFNETFPCEEDTDFIIRASIESPLAYYNGVNGIVNLFPDELSRTHSAYPASPIPIPGEFWIIDNAKTNPQVRYCAYELYMNSINKNIKMGFFETAQSQLTRIPEIPKEYGFKGKVTRFLMKHKLKKHTQLKCYDEFEGGYSDIISVGEGI